MCVLWQMAFPRAAPVHPRFCTYHLTRSCSDTTYKLRTASDSGKFLSHEGSSRTTSLLVAKLSSASHGGL